MSEREGLAVCESQLALGLKVERSDSVMGPAAVTVVVPETDAQSVRVALGVNESQDEEGL